MGKYHQLKAEQKKNNTYVFTKEYLDQWKENEKKRILSEANCLLETWKEKERERIIEEANEILSEKYIEREKELMDAVDAKKEEITRDAIDKAFVLMIGIPTRVLKHNYRFGNRKRLPDFANAVAKYYADFQDGEMSVDEYQDLVVKECGIGYRIRQEEVEDNECQ